jgi:outer membrane lipoprotein-sorting protein
MRSTENIKRSIQQLDDKTSENLNKRTLDDIYSAMDTQQTVQLKPSMWRTIMHSKTAKIAAGFIIVFGMLFGFNFIGGPDTGAVFASVIEKLAAAQTASFDLSIEFGEQPAQTSSFLYDADGYIRQNMANGAVNVIDYNQGKVLSLDPETMTATLRDVKNGSFHSAMREIFETFHEMLVEATELAEGDVLSLGTATINNRNAYGYQIETTVQKPGLYWQGRGTLTIWADAETDFPLELQWYSAMTNLRVTVSNIGLDMCIDQTEFNMDVPEGYDLPVPPEAVETVAEPNEVSAQETETDIVPDPDLAELLDDLDKTDQTLVKFFHGWTVLTKGKFPSSLTTDAIKDIDPDAKISFKQKLWSFSFSASLPNLFGDWKADIDPNDYTDEEMEQSKKEPSGRYYEDIQAAFEERFQLVKPHFANVFDGFEAVLKMPAKSDWHYNGAGVKFGDSGTAIFWYKPKGLDCYRVVFGDLTIEDIAADDVYLLENPSDEEIDKNASDLLEAALQLGANIPKDKRATVLRVLSLKEKDLIKGLATYLEFSEGTYPLTMSFDKTFVKNENKFITQAFKDRQFDEKQGKAKTLDIGFAAFFFDKLAREKKEPVYYGDTVTVNDPDKVLVRWKMSKDRYRVVYGSLKTETVTAERLDQIEGR